MEGTWLAARPGTRPVGPAGAGPRGPAGGAPCGPAGRRPSARLESRRPPAGLDALVFAFVELFCEVEAGWREPRQLQRLMSPRLYARLSGRWFRGGPVGRVMAVRGQHTGAGSYEAAVVVARGPRTGAVGVRLLRWDDRWRVEEVVRPEEGALPEATTPFPEDHPDSFGRLQPLPSEAWGVGDGAT